MTTRAQIVEQALTYKDVPWRHMGRSRKGVDCIGLLICVGRDLGLCAPDFDTPPYSKHPDGRMLEGFAEHCDRIPTHAIRPGSMLVFSYYGSPYHTAIVIDPDTGAMVHALASARRCIVDLISNKQYGRTLIGAWDYRGVTDG